MRADGPKITDDAEPIGFAGFRSMITNVSADIALAERLGSQGLQHSPRPSAPTATRSAEPRQPTSRANWPLILLVVAAIGGGILYMTDDPRGQGRVNSRLGVRDRDPKRIGAPAVDQLHRPAGGDVQQGGMRQPALRRIGCKFIRQGQRGNALAGAQGDIIQNPPTRTEPQMRLLRRGHALARPPFGASGQDRGGVWVSGGCRAEFEVVDQRSNWGSGWGDNRWNDDGYDRGSPRNGLVRCESNGARGGYCRADTSRGVRLANQMSSAQCVEGQSWGYDRSGIWVSHGCRAEFLLAGSGQGGWNSNEGGYGDGGRNSGTVTCESQDGRYVFCRTGRVRQVQLQRQLSRGACVQNETWGYRADGIWVSNGCRGEFSLY